MEFQPNSELAKNVIFIIILRSETVPGLSDC